MSKRPHKKLTVIQKEMIETFQCPGCVRGCDVECGSLKLVEPPGGAFKCDEHVAGTMMMPGGGSFMLGMPKGFNRVGTINEILQNNNIVRLWSKGAFPKWEKLNVPVWSMKRDGYTFVRTYSPRINITWVDVIEGDVDVPALTLPIDVGAFYDEID